jgi:hypothetical protein
VVWTDTRTGVQELFYDRIDTSKTDYPEWWKGISGKVFGGVANDGGGFIIVNGKIIRIPPRGPKYAIMQSLVALDAAEEIDHPQGAHVVQSIAEAIVGIGKDLAKGKVVHAGRAAVVVEADQDSGVLKEKAVARGALGARPGASST